MENIQLLIDVLALILSNTIIYGFIGLVFFIPLAFLYVQVAYTLVLCNTSIHAYERVNPDLKKTFDIDINIKHWKLKYYFNEFIKFNKLSYIGLKLKQINNLYTIHFWFYPTVDMAIFMKDAKVKND